MSDTNSTYPNQNLELKYSLSKIQVNNSLMPARVFTSFWIKTVAFRMILMCEVVFGLVYKIGTFFLLPTPYVSAHAYSI